MQLKYHPSLTPQKWATFALSRRILMIANELNRAGSAINRGDGAETTEAYERAFELTYLTIATVNGRGLLRELARFKEVLASLYIQKDPSFEDNSRLQRVLISLNAPSSVQTIAMNVCAFAPTIVVLFMFRRLFPGVTFREFLRRNFISSCT